MNGRRDIERTLDHWLADGPSVMPDRLFDAVLDRVERTPQRRFARLHLRLTEMNPRIRIYALAAAGLVVAVVGLYLFGRGRPDANVGGTSSPGATPGPTISMYPPTLVPAALRHVWMGAPRPIPGLEADAGVALSFDEFGNFWMSQSNLDDARRLQSRVEVLPGDGVRLRTAALDADCDLGDAGGYFWTLSASGETLEISQPGDGCELRRAAVPGTYWRADCPTADNNCLGVLDPGTYASQFIDPFLGLTEAWTARYGAITYTVPAGWVNAADWPGSFNLAPANAGPGTGILFVTDAVAPSEDDDCSEQASQTIGQDAESIAAWVATAPGVTSTAPVQLVIGGRDAWRVDIGLDPAWTAPCPAFSEGKPARVMFVDRSSSEGYVSALLPGQQDRYYLIDVGDRAMLVQIEALTPEAFDAFVGEATTIVESIQLAP